MSDQLEASAQSFIDRITQHSSTGIIHPELYEADVETVRQLVTERRQLKRQLAINSVAAQVPEISTERVAQLIAHRAVGNQEQDLSNGKIAGYCLVCQTPWPCSVAQPAPPQPAPDESALRDAARWDALHTLMIIGNVGLEQAEHGGWCISVDPVENMAPMIWSGDTPEEAVDNVIKALAATEGICHE